MQLLQTPKGSIEVLASQLARWKVRTLLNAILQTGSVHQAPYHLFLLEGKQGRQDFGLLRTEKKVRSFPI